MLCYFSVHMKYLGVLRHIYKGGGYRYLGGDEKTRFYGIYTGMNNICF
jgi:hypothetical protein